MWIRALFLLFALLVIPIVLLLFAQWPLRDLIQAGSRLANDMGQLSFGLYMATAVTAASVAGVHLACHLPGRGSIGGEAVEGSRWRGWALLLCVAPWALMILVTYGGTVVQSVRSLEGFPDTGHPGFFLLRLGVLWMALLVLIHAVWEVLVNSKRRRAA